MPCAAALTVPDSCACRCALTIVPAAAADCSVHFRFRYMWPNARISVMGGEQAASVLSQVGKFESPAAEETFKAGMRDKYDVEGSPCAVPPPPPLTDHQNTQQHTLFLRAELFALMQVPRQRALVGRWSHIAQGHPKRNCVVAVGRPECPHSGYKIRCVSHVSGGDEMPDGVAAVSVF
jgi:hypothetical protein